MQKIDLAVIPYRKEIFERRYGCTVRDLMMMRALASLSNVERVIVFERPDVVPEAAARLLWPPGDRGKIQWRRKIGWNLLAQFVMRRKWAVHAFRMNEAGLQQWKNDVLPGARKILLDFQPIYQPPASIVSDILYWYDMIDNFTKHHRYDATEQAMVRNKYDFVKRHAGVVTGVTAQSIEGFHNSLVIPNRLMHEIWAHPALQNSAEYDLGFLGFITDKFDIEFIERCSSVGLKILICGHSFNRATITKLSSIKGVTWSGKFSAREAPKLIQKFNVGLIPYRSDKLHDESPIKFFQYIVSGRPVLQSLRFNAIENAFPNDVGYYHEMTNEQLLTFVHRAANPDVRKKLAETAANIPEVFWEPTIANIVEETMQSTR